jgi:hypothetical protein
MVFYVRVCRVFVFCRHVYMLGCLNEGARNMNLRDLIDENGKFVIPQGVTEIGEGAFARCPWKPKGE